MEKLKRHWLQVSIVVIVPLTLYLVLAWQASWRPITLPGVQGYIYNVAFASDGRTLIATCESDTTTDSLEIKLWDVQRQTLAREIKLPPAPTSSSAFLSSDNSKVTIAIGQDESQISLNEFDARTAKLLRTLPLGNAGASSHYNNTEYQLGFTLWPNNHVLTCSGDTFIKQFDARTGKLLRKLPTPGGKLGEVVFAADGATVASMHLKPNMSAQFPGRNLGSDTYSGVDIWDARNGKVRCVVAAKDTATSTLSFSPDSRILASVADTVKLWDARTGRLLRTLTPATVTGRSLYPLSSIIFSPDSKKVVAGGMSTRISVWDAATGKLERTIISRHFDITALDISPDGSTLAVGSGDGTVQLWRLK